MAPTPNKFGRRPGRGLRPWLLLPKILSVALYLGSLASTLALCLSTDFADAPSPDTTATISHASLLIRFITVPSLLAAIFFGLLLFLQHPREFSRMRWLRAKLLLILLTIPAAHFYLSTRLAHLHDPDADAPLYAHQFTLGLCATLLLSLLIATIGRLKPRLGQPYSTPPTRT